MDGLLQSDLHINGSFSTSDTLIETILKNNEINGSLGLNNITFEHTNKNLSFESLSGQIAIDKQVRLNNVMVYYLQSAFKINGDIPVSSINNLSFNYFNANIECNSLKIDTGVNSKEKNKFTFPIDKYRGNLKLTINELSYGAVKLKNIDSKLRFSNQGIYIEKLDCSTLNGKASNEGLLSKKNDNIRLALSSNLQNIDISLLFKKFNNFGQNTLKSDHLKGLLTSKVSLNALFDSNFDLIGKSLETESSVEINNGELNNFEPINALSTFIKMEELRNIKFSNLKNNVNIKNRLITIPRMDIKTSALNLSLYGTHDFDNNFEYHIRILLSDVLFNKFRSSNNNTLSDSKDEKGKFYIYYCIKGNMDKFDIKYDTKNAKEQFKKNLITEKNTLLKIFKDEINSYKSDSIKVDDEPEVKKIQIEHDEIKPVKEINSSAKPLVKQPSKPKPKLEQWKDE